MGIRRRGLTLLEILIACLILVVLGLVMYWMFINSARAQMMGHLQMEAQQNCRTALDRISQELRRAIPPPVYGTTEAYRSGVIWPNVNQGMPANYSNPTDDDYDIDRDASILNPDNYFLPDGTLITQPADYKTVTDRDTLVFVERTQQSTVNGSPAYHDANNLDYFILVEYRVLRPGETISNVNLPASTGPCLVRIPWVAKDTNTNTGILGLIFDVTSPTRPWTTNLSSGTRNIHNNGTVFQYGDGPSKIIELPNENDAIRLKVWHPRFPSGFYDGYVFRIMVKITQTLNNQAMPADLAMWKRKEVRLETQVMIR